MNDFCKPEQLDKDDHGRLYDRSIREYLTSFIGPSSARRLESLAAVKWLVKEMQHHQSRRRERHGLSEGRADLLIRLKFKGDLPLGELAEQLHVSARNITGLVDHLERDGLVQRIPDRADRRCVRAHLTSQGAELIEGVWRQTLERTLETISEIPQEELDQLRHTCLRLVEAMGVTRKEGLSDIHG
jgi:DNA-binding MarR family transcriptional regulator